MPCETGGGGPGQTVSNTNYDNTGENQKYVYFANGGSFRVLFRAILEKREILYSAYGYIKLEENNNILFFDNWRERNAETLTLTGASLSLTFNHKQNTTSRITSYDSFQQTSITNKSVLASNTVILTNTADFTIPPYYELESVDFGNVIGTMTRQEGNIFYTIARRVDFKKP